MAYNNSSTSKWNWDSKKTTFLMLGLLVVVILVITLYGLVNDDRHQEETMTGAGSDQAAINTGFESVETSSSPLPADDSGVIIDPVTGSVTLTDPVLGAKRAAVLALMDAQLYWQGVYTLAGMRGYFNSTISDLDMLRQMNGWEEGVREWANFGIQDIRATEKDDGGFIVTIVLWGHHEDTVHAQNFETVMEMTEMGGRFLIDSVRVNPPSKTVQNVNVWAPFDWDSLGFTE